MADAAVSVTEFARLGRVRRRPARSSTDSSLTDETSSSVDAATDSACDAVSLSEAAIWLTPPTASSSARTCDLGAVATRHRRCARCRWPSPSRARRGRGRARSPTAMRAARRRLPPLLLMCLRGHDLLSLLPITRPSPTVCGLGKVQNAIQIQARGSADRRSDAIPSTYRPLMPGQRLVRRLNRVGRDAHELARGVGDQADQPRARLDDDQPRCAGRTARARNRTVRAG